MTFLIRPPSAAKSRSGFIRLVPIGLSVLFLIISQCTQRRVANPLPNVLEVSQDSLVFSLVAEGPAGPTQMVEVRNATGNPLTYQTTYKEPWLQVFDHSVTPDTIFVFASSRDLLQGTYRDTIKVTASTAEGSPHNIAVIMNVSRGIKTLPANVTLTTLLGGPPLAQETLIVAPTGGGTMFFDITNTVPWLSISRLHGVGRDTLMMSFQTSGLARGRYTYNFQVAASQAANSPISVACTLSVASWGTLTSNDSYGLRGIEFLTPGIGIAVGFKRTVLGVDGCVFRTTDSGVTWVPKMIAHGAALVGLRFLSPQLGYTFGEKGDLLVTRDGGITWSFVLSSQIETIFDLEIPAPDTFYYVGGQGTIWCSFDNGVNWGSKTLPSAFPMYSAKFIDGHRGWVVGGGGTILYTDDAGDTWQQAPPVTNADLRNIFLLDSATGCIVGDAGTILSRIDGNKWVQQLSGVQLDLRKVQFADRQIGWIVGEAVIVLHTKDGGQSWRQQAPNTSFGLFDVWFMDNRRGWVAGDNGLIMTTYSGGEDQ